MTNYINKILLFLAGILFPIIVPGSTLPTLPPASQVVSGVLDNGVTYYLVTNPTEKGKAEIALVRKGGYDTEDIYGRGSSVVNAMDALTVLPHFTTNTPYKFFKRNCIWPGQSGYVATTSDASIYRFSNLELSRTKDIVDSTMLLVFDIIAVQANNLDDRYVPANQAIVISGDIDAGAVLNKMNMLAMLVSRRRGPDISRKYDWKVSDGPAYRHIQSDNKKIARVTVEYESPRTPVQNMPTVQPLVSQKFSSELGIILKKRLRNAFRKADIPVSGIHYSYQGSGEGPGNEKYRISVGTSVGRLDEVVSIISSTLAGLDENGSVAEEYRDAQNELLLDLRRDYTGDVVENSRYVDLCISSFLYGSSLASSKSRIDFFLTRDIRDDIGVRLFNNFVFSLLDKSKNLTLECEADSALVDGGRMLKTFSSSWKPVAEKPYIISRSDTLKIRKNVPKVKLKLSTAEPLSGGQQWTFDNGLKVIFKHIPNTGTFRYMWILKGGYSLMPGLKSGEGAYVSDLLSLYNVAGMDCVSFSDMLDANGISMDCDVTMSDLRISGAAPSSRLSLLLRSIYSLSSDRAMNHDAYEYYRKCQYLRMDEDPSPEAVLDDLMFPKYAYSTYRKKITLTDDFQKRTEKYFENEFSKMNDGVLILVGDFNEYELKKSLSRELGGFRTDKVSVMRSRYQSRNASGVETRVVDGKNSMFEMGFSSPLLFTSSSYMSSCITAMALRDRIAEALAVYGWAGKFRWEFESFPEERFSFYVNASAAEKYGLPASLVQTDSVEAVMSGVRSAVSSFAAKGISGSELAIYKASLSKLLDSRMAAPETIMAMLVLRYSCGKDLVTKYGEKLNTVSEASVNDVLRALASGRNAAYAVNAPRPPFRDIVLEEPDLSPYKREVLPAPDSTGMTVEGFRMIGLDTTSRPLYWTDNDHFKLLVKELPKAKRYIPSRPKPVIDTVGARNADSTMTVSRDSMVFVVDSTGHVLDSLRIAADSAMFADINVLFADSTRVMVDSAKLDVLTKSLGITNVDSLRVRRKKPEVPIREITPEPARMPDVDTVFRITLKEDE